MRRSFQTKRPSASISMIRVTPTDLFDRRKTTVVGYFIGAPAMNFLSCEIHDARTVRLGDAIIKTNTDMAAIKSNNIKLGIRAEYIRITQQMGSNRLSASIQRVEDWVVIS